MKNFWQELPRPFTVLAPLDGVTDTVFRRMILTLGKPDVLFTEFTSCDGLLSEGREKVAQSLRFSPEEQPVIAQIWGANPRTFYESAKLVQDLGFTGVDINMGCPDRAVIKDGSCSALIRNPKLATEVIQATKDGAPYLPVSVKTRIGFEQQDLDWIEFLLGQNISALSVHLRTVEELSKVPAHWELMPEIVNLRERIAPQTTLIGNGDITSLQEIEEKFEQYGCDGFMVGRGIFANPWMFNREKKMEDIRVQERFDTFIRHIDLFSKIWGKRKSSGNLKKFCKTYINNFPEAARYREKIMETETLEELRTMVESVRQELITKAH